MDTDNDPWNLLNAEFDAWAGSGRPATLWWRDDDASASGPKLERLIELSAPAGILLAVIPARLQSDLVKALDSAPHVQVAQHGYAHTNHAPRGQGLGAWELGMHRGLEAVMDDLDAGRERLETSFAERFLPIIVPPWNHIDPTLFNPIASRDYAGVSAFGPRAEAEPVSGLSVVNAHCDPIRWKTGAEFRGDDKTIAQLLEHLRARRTGQADVHEVTGYLTHHIDLDPPAWEFSARLAQAVQDHPGAAWVAPQEVFRISR